MPSLRCSLLVLLVVLVDVSTCQPLSEAMGGGFSILDFEDSLPSHGYEESLVMNVFGTATYRCQLWQTGVQWVSDSISGELHPSNVAQPNLNPFGKFTSVITELRAVWRTSDGFVPSDLYADYLQEDPFEKSLSISKVVSSPYPFTSDEVVLPILAMTANLPVEMQSLDLAAVQTTNYGGSYLDEGAPFDQVAFVVQGHTEGGKPLVTQSLDRSMCDLDAVIKLPFVAQHRLYRKAVAVNVTVGDTPYLLEPLQEVPPEVTLPPSSTASRSFYFDGHLHLECPVDSWRLSAFEGPLKHSPSSTMSFGVLRRCSNLGGTQCIDVAINQTVEPRNGHLVDTSPVASVFVTHDTADMKLAERREVYTRDFGEADMTISLLGTPKKRLAESAQRQLWQVQRSEDGYGWPLRTTFVLMSIQADAPSTAIITSKSGVESNFVTDNGAGVPAFYLIQDAVRNVACEQGAVLDWHVKADIVFYDDAGFPEAIQAPDGYENFKTRTMGGQLTMSCAPLRHGDQDGVLVVEKEYLVTPDFTFDSWYDHARIDYAGQPLHNMSFHKYTAVITRVGRTALLVANMSGAGLLEDEAGGGGGGGGGAGVWQPWTKWNAWSDADSLWSSKPEVFQVFHHTYLSDGLRPGDPCRRPAPSPTPSPLPSFSPTPTPSEPGVSPPSATPSPPPSLSPIPSSTEEPESEFSPANATWSASATPAAPATPTVSPAGTSDTDKRRQERDVAAAPSTSIPSPSSAPSSTPALPLPPLIDGYVSIAIGATIRLLSPPSRPPRAPVQTRPLYGHAMSTEVGRLYGEGTMTFECSAVVGAATGNSSEGSRTMVWGLRRSAQLLFDARGDRHTYPASVPRGTNLVENLGDEIPTCDDSGGYTQDLTDPNANFNDLTEKWTLYGVDHNVVGTASSRFQGIAAVPARQSPFNTPRDPANIPVAGSGVSTSQRTYTLARVYESDLILRKYTHVQQRVVLEDAFVQVLAPGGCTPENEGALATVDFESDVFMYSLRRGPLLRPIAVPSFDELVVDMAAEGTALYTCTEDGSLRLTSLEQDITSVGDGCLSGTLVANTQVGDVGSVEQLLFQLDVTQGIGGEEVLTIMAVAFLDTDMQPLVNRNGLPWSRLGVSVNDVTLFEGTTQPIRPTFLQLIDTLGGLPPAGVSCPIPDLTHETGPIGGGEGDGDEGDGDGDDPDPGSETIDPLPQFRVPFRSNYRLFGARDTATPEIPPEASVIEVPPGHTTRSVRLYGSSRSVYVCASGTYVPSASNTIGLARTRGGVNIGSVKVLTDSDLGGGVVKWTILNSDGGEESSATGTVVAEASGQNAAPLQLVKTTSTSGRGLLSRTSYVQRLTNVGWTSPFDDPDECGGPTCIGCKCTCVDGAQWVSNFDVWYWFYEATIPMRLSPPPGNVLLVQYEASGHQTFKCDTSLGQWIPHSSSMELSKIKSVSRNDEETMPELVGTFQRSSVEVTPTGDDGSDLDLEPAARSSIVLDDGPLQYMWHLGEKMFGEEVHTLEHCGPYDSAHNVVENGDGGADGGAGGGDGGDVDDSGHRVDKQGATNLLAEGCLGLARTTIFRATAHKSGGLVDMAAYVVRVMEDGVTDPFDPSLAPIYPSEECPYIPTDYLSSPMPTTTPPVTATATATPSTTPSPTPGLTVAPTPTAIPPSLYVDMPVRACFLFYHSSVARPQFPSALRVDEDTYEFVYKVFGRGTSSWLCGIDAVTNATSWSLLERNLALFNIPGGTRFGNMKYDHQSDLYRFAQDRPGDVIEARLKQAVDPVVAVGAMILPDVLSDADLLALDANADYAIYSTTTSTIDETTEVDADDVRVSDVSAIQETGTYGGLPEEECTRSLALSDVPVAIAELQSDFWLWRVSLPPWIVEPSGVDLYLALDGTSKASYECRQHSREPTYYGEDIVSYTWDLVGVDGTLSLPSNLGSLKGKITMTPAPGSDGGSDGLRATYAVSAGPDELITSQVITEEIGEWSETKGVNYPWKLFIVTGRGGAKHEGDLFTGVTYVQQINTVGGNVDASCSFQLEDGTVGDATCQESTVNSTAACSFDAIYRFFEPSQKAPEHHDLVFSTSEGNLADWNSYYAKGVVEYTCPNTTSADGVDSPWLFQSLKADMYTRPGEDIIAGHHFIELGTRSAVDRFTAPLLPAEYNRKLGSTEHAFAVWNIRTTPNNASVFAYRDRLTPSASLPDDALSWERYHVMTSSPHLNVDMTIPTISADTDTAPYVPMKFVDFVTRVDTRDGVITPEHPACDAQMYGTSITVPFTAYYWLILQPQCSVDCNAQGSCEFNPDREQPYCLCQLGYLTPSCGVSVSKPNTYWGKILRKQTTIYFGELGPGLVPSITFPFGAVPTHINYLNAHVEFIDFEDLPVGAVDPRSPLTHPPLGMRPVNQLTIMVSLWDAENITFSFSRLKGLPTMSMPYASFGLTPAEARGLTMFRYNGLSWVQATQGPACAKLVNNPVKFELDVGICKEGQLQFFVPGLRDPPDSVEFVLSRETTSTPERKARSGVDVDEHGAQWDAAPMDEEDSSDVTHAWFRGLVSLAAALPVATVAVAVAGMAALILVLVMVVRVRRTLRTEQAEMETAERQQRWITLHSPRK